MLRQAKYIIAIIVFFVIAPLFYLSCQKETKLVYEERLTGVTWKLYDCTTSDSSFYAVLDSCEKDNAEKFNMDGTYIHYEGVRKCKATDPIEQRGTWSFSTDRKTLYLINYKAIKSSFNVIKLDKDFLNISYIDTASQTIILFFKPKL